MIDAEQFWDDRFSLLTAQDRTEIAQIMADAEPRRGLAKFNTGSIPLMAAQALRALTKWITPQTIVEVGTFIGVSTLSMKASEVYTCDISNNCLPTGLYGSTIVTAHPYCKSTDMFKRLCDGGQRAGMFFFDGLLTDEDPQLIARIAKPRALYVFDDFDGEHKGVQNAKRLRRLLPHHVLVMRAGPIEHDTTLAAMVHASMV